MNDGTTGNPDARVQFFSPMRDWKLLESRRREREKKEIVHVTTLAPCTLLMFTASRRTGRSSMGDWLHCLLSHRLPFGHFPWQTTIRESHFFPRALAIVQLESWLQFLLLLWVSNMCLTGWSLSFLVDNANGDDTGPLEPLCLAANLIQTSYFPLSQG